MFKFIKIWLVFAGLISGAVLIGGLLLIGPYLIVTGHVVVGIIVFSVTAITLLAFGWYFGSEEDYD